MRSPRRHVRRGRLRRRRRPRRRGRPRRDRRPPRALAQPRSRTAPAPAAAAPSRTAATPAAPRTSSASRSTSGTSPTASTRTWSRTSWPSTPPAARPTRACAATRRSSSPRCSTGRWPSASTRSRPGHYAQLRTGDDGLDRAAPRRRHGQGPVLRPRRPRPGAARALALPARRHQRRTRSAREAARRGLLVAEKPDSHDICFVADGDNAGWLRDKLGDRAPTPAATSSTTPRARCSAPTRAPYGFTIGQRKGLRHRHARPPTASRASCSTSSRSPAPSPSAPRGPATSTGSPASGRAGAAPSPPCSRPGVTVQLRAHGAEHRAVVTVERRWRPVAIELLDPAEGIAPGQAAVLYDGTPRRRLGDHQRDRPLGGARVSALASGVGSMPGDRRPGVRRGGARRARRAARLPHVPELPGRGARRRR